MSTATRAPQARREHPEAVPAPRRSLRAPLQVVAPVPGRAARAPFVLLVAALLGGALLVLLMINTALGQGAFVIHDLQRSSDGLVDQQQALQQELALESSPQRLAQRAVALGMVPSTNPAFLRLSDGKVLGKPTAGVRPAPAATAAPSTAAASATAAAKRPAATARATARPTARATGGTR